MSFTEKLNKKEDGSVYVIEEVQTVTDGVYEGYLEHDNVTSSTVAVYTGSNLTGNAVTTFTLSKPSDTLWKTFIKIYAGVDNVYITYETTGDTVEADDINKLQDEIKKYKTVSRIIGFAPAIADYVCDGVCDDAQFQHAIDDLSTVNGGSIFVLYGTYYFSKCVRLSSNIKITFAKGAKIIMDAQVSAVMTSNVAIGDTTVTVSSSDISKFQTGMEIGFISDSTIGYKSGEDACYITNISDNIITFSTAATKEYTANTAVLVSLNSGFVATDSATTNLTDIEIIGGEIDGNKTNNPIWVRDMHQNGIIVGGIHNLKLRNVVVHDFNFQNIHVSGTMLNGDNIGTLLENCICYNSSSSGITLDTVPDETAVINCISYSNGNSGLQLVDVNKCTVLGGYYQSNGFCGIRSAHDSMAVTGNKFIGVSAVGNGRGFGIRNNVGTIISGCSTKGNTDYGICLEEDCINTQVCNCTLESEAVGINELSTGANGNIIINPVFIDCTTNYSLSDASLFDMTGGIVATNKAMKPNRMIINAANNHLQLAESGSTYWHMESVGQVFSLVQSGVLERLIISGADATLNANFKMYKFGCNGKESQASVTVNSALSDSISTLDATSLNATNALVNQLRTALINNGICI